MSKRRRGAAFAGAEAGPQPQALCRKRKAMVVALAWVTPANVWRAWSWEPGIVAPLGLSLGLYAAGALRLGRRLRRGRERRELQAAAFAAGWGTLFAALVSPIHELGETLFSVHMLQHELLIMMAAPLLAASRPGAVMLWAFPAAARAGLGRLGQRLHSYASALARPLPCGVLFTFVLWLWHVPALYQAAVRNPALHALEHASFFCVAYLFWWMLLPRRRGLSAAAAGWSCLAAAAQTSGLGLWLACSSRPWYPVYSSRVALWNLTPLADQRIGGLLMWITGGVPLAMLGLLLFLLPGWKPLRLPETGTESGREAPAIEFDRRTPFQAG